jgi:peptidylprolyl isomerase
MTDLIDMILDRKESQMLKARIGDIVEVSLAAKLDDGTEVISTKGAKRISFTIGAGKVIRDLEKAVISMAQGQSKTVTIPPEDAFGRYNGKGLIVMDRRNLPANLAPCKGQFMKIKKTNGSTGIAKVVDMNEARVMLDTNHILAGKEIVLEFELLEVLLPDRKSQKTPDHINSERAILKNERLWNS